MWLFSFKSFAINSIRSRRRRPCRHFCGDNFRPEVVSDVRSGAVFDPNGIVMSVLTLVVLGQTVLEITAHFVIDERTTKDVQRTNDAGGRRLSHTAEGETPCWRFAKKLASEGQHSPTCHINYLFLNFFRKLLDHST